MQQEKFWITVLFLLEVVTTPGLTWAAEAKYSTSWWRGIWLERYAPRRLERAKIKEFLRLIAKTEKGRELLITAQSRDPQFLQKIHAGEHSLTETVFSRSFSLQDATESVEKENFLQVKRNLSRKEAIWDLSHELTHFVYRRPSSPYRAEHSLSEFIQEGIEGDGGELDAFQTECEISWELEGMMNLPLHTLCFHYKSIGMHGRAVFLRERARRDYYAIGSYYEYMKKWKNGLPLLTDQTIIFSSSLEKTPYPLALVTEYENVLRAACENNERKAYLISLQSARLKELRSPASVIQKLAQEEAAVENYVKNHCQK